MKSVDVKTLYQELPNTKNHNTICIDVRTPSEYRAVHINNSRNIPLDKLNEYKDELTKYDTVYVSCGSGMRSSEACKKLQSLGLNNIVNVEGGIKACQQMNLPLEKGKSSISLIRQVHLAASTLILLGLVLSYFFSNYYLILPLAVGIGLFYAGASGNCLMAIFLSKMPWNK